MFAPLRVALGRSRVRSRHWGISSTPLACSAHQKPTTRALPIRSSWRHLPCSALGLPEPWASLYPECTVADGLRRSLWEQTAHIRAVRLDPEQAQAWWNEGRALDLDAAIALIPTIEPEAAQPAERPGGLSPREVDVLRLLAQGHTDREIAELLFISPRTVQNHVHRIYARIDVSSRSAATRWAMDHGIA